MPDDQNARLIVSRIIVDTLQGLKMAYLELSAKQHKELCTLRKLLAK